MFPKEEPWVLGSCIECKRFELSQTSTYELTRECPYCKRHWYKYDSDKKLWRQITDPSEWESIINQVYQVNLYPNSRDEERPNDPRVRVVVEYFQAENDERAKQLASEKFGLSQDVELYAYNGHRKLEF